MKKIGIIGGAGPLASSLLYETLIHESYTLGRQIPEIVLINFPFTRGLSLNEGKENEKLIHTQLSYCVQFLARSGVELGVLACNTLHLFLKHHSHPALQFYHLPELVVKAAQRHQHHRLLILGTQNTCLSNLYHMPGIETSYPSFDDQATINEIIDRVLEGKILSKDSALVSRIIDKTLLKNEFDAVVLGCTDFPVLHHRFPIASSKPLYDSIKIPAKTLAGVI